VGCNGVPGVGSYKLAGVLKILNPGRLILMAYILCGVYFLIGSRGRYLYMGWGGATSCTETGL
jgi:hypothetical protein